jgi:hypothetical protein
VTHSAPSGSLSPTPQRHGSSTTQRCLLILLVADGTRTSPTRYRLTAFALAAGPEPKGGNHVDRVAKLDEQSDAATTARAGRGELPWTDGEDLEITPARRRQVADVLPVTGLSEVVAALCTRRGAAVPGGDWVRGPNPNALEFRRRYLHVVSETSTSWNCSASMSTATDPTPGSPWPI